MKLKPVKVWKAKREELGALAGVYVVLTIFSLIFLSVIYRASLVIQSNSSINSKSYLITHVATFLMEVVLWTVIARAAVHLKSYTSTVIESADGRALNYIANAFLLSLVYAMLFGVASTIKTLFWQTGSLRLITDVTNILPVVAVVALSLALYIGSVKLSRIPKHKYHFLRSRGSMLSLGVFCVAAVTYAVYFYQQAQGLLDDDGLHHFVLSRNVLMVVYVLPYIVALLLSLLACLRLVHYAKSVQGNIYRLLFQDLSTGLIISFIGIYFAQIFYISNLASNRIGPGLIFILVLLGLLIKGSLLVYRGTTQLDQLEATY